MTIYRPEDLAENGVIFRWRLAHRKLRTAKKKRERWLYEGGRRWDVRHAGRHDTCMHLARRPAAYAVRLEGWRKLRRLAFFNSMWDCWSGADLRAAENGPAASGGSDE